MPDKTHIFLIGIGGIGMSALARYFLGNGLSVAGYDRVKNQLCHQLEAEGITIIYEDQPDKIPGEFTNPHSTEVIYTPAIPADNQLMIYCREQGFKLKKRARCLGEISQQHQCLAVAGTHGKTTTSSLLAHLFQQAGKNPTAFLGGVAVDYQSNYISGQPGGIMIAEADEYDRSFLELKVKGGIITSTESDHLDVYGKAENLKAAFSDFATIVEGPLVVHHQTELQGLTYAVEEKADYHAANVRIANHQFVFDLIARDQLIEGIRSALPGRHNIENSVAAAALALEFGLKAEEVKNGIDSFRGVKRRFEYHITRDNLIYIDDYAHHPSEIRALVTAVRELYPDLEITGIFQPHLYSRTRDFAEEFAGALSLLDELILMDIYPARERPIPGINAGWLLDKVALQEKSQLNRNQILDRFSEKKPQVILSIGAGDIDNLVQPLKMALLQ